MYKLTEVKARLHTGGKTVDEIRERYTGQGLTYRNFESLRRAFDLFDGQEINLYWRFMLDGANWIPILLIFLISGCIPRFRAKVIFMRGIR